MVKIATNYRREGTKWDLSLCSGMELRNPTMSMLCGNVGRLEKDIERDVDVWKTLRNYTNLLSNVMINRIIKLLLKQPRSTVLRSSLEKSNVTWPICDYQNQNCKEITLSIY